MFKQLKPITKSAIITFLFLKGPVFGFNDHVHNFTKNLVTLHIQRFMNFFGNIIASQGKIKPNLGL